MKWDLRHREIQILYKVNKVKVKLSLCLTKHHAMKPYWRVEVQLNSFIDLGTRCR
jgi:hypothetical protein